MGRKRIPEDEKKIGVKLTITKKYLDELKAKDLNISKLFEEFVKDYLNK